MKPHSIGKALLKPETHEACRLSMPDTAAALPSE